MLRNPIFILAAALLAGTALTLPARAQDDAAYEGPERVIVQPPAESFHHYPDGTARLSRAVDITDLDLTTADGARALRERIRFTARDVCEELWDRTTAATERVQDSDVRQCARKAYRSAMSQVRYAIADAREDAYEDR